MTTISDTATAASSPVAPSSSGLTNSEIHGYATADMYGYEAASAPPIQALDFHTVPFEDDPSEMTRDDDMAFMMAADENEKAKQKKKRRKQIKTAAAVVGGVVGLAVAGPMGAVLAGGGGFVLAKVAVNSYRQKNATQQQTQQEYSEPLKKGQDQRQHGEPTERKPTSPPAAAFAKEAFSDKVFPYGVSSEE